MKSPIFPSSGLKTGFPPNQGSNMRKLFKMENEQNVKQSNAVKPQSKSKLNKGVNWTYLNFLVLHLPMGLTPTVLDWHLLDIIQVKSDYASVSSFEHNSLISLNNCICWLRIGRSYAGRRSCLKYDVHLRCNLLDIERKCVTKLCLTWSFGSN